MIFYVLTEFLLFLLHNPTETIAADGFIHRNDTGSRVLTNATICAFPAFLKTALGIVCTEKEVRNSDHLWFAPVAQPVSVAHSQGDACADGRYEWNHGNASLCCLELSCPVGQVLAKDHRNTPAGECPKCRNVIFEYICDPLNDTCNSLHNGSYCRKFFNSTDIYICGCDARNGFTQNRLAFPAACTKTIGAVCFFQEHCKFVDPNSKCDLWNDTRPARGTCQCKKGYTENSDGRCVEKIRQVREAVVVADWGDKSIWASGPVEKYPIYDFTMLTKKSHSANPVLRQVVEDSSADDRFYGRRTVRSVANSTGPLSKSEAKSTTHQTWKPQPYMIAAQHMVPEESSAKQVKTAAALTTSAPGIANALNLSSASAVSGTKFASEDDKDSQVDNVLNIIRPARRKLQTERPVTSKMYDATAAPATRETVTTVTLSPSTTPASTTKDVFKFAPRFTRQPPSATTSKLIHGSLDDILTGSALHDAVHQTDGTTKTFIQASSTLSSTMTSTSTTSTVTTPKPIPSTTISTTTAAPKSTTQSTKSTTITVISTSTPVPSTPRTTVPTSPSTAAASTVNLVEPPVTTNFQIQVPSKVSQLHTDRSSWYEVGTTASVLNSQTMGDQDDMIMVDNTEGVIKVHLGDSSRRFGGVVRVPAHAVIGGVGRPPQPQSSNAESFKSGQPNVRPNLNPILPATVPVTTQSPTVPPTVTTPAALPEIDALPATTKASIFEQHGVDLSFLQDRHLSKTDMQKKLLQAIFELSATTTRTTTTTSTTTTTTAKPALDLSFLSDPHLSAADIQMKLLPLLMQLNSQQTPAPETTTTTSTTTEAPRTVPIQTLSADLDLAAALAQLRKLQAADRERDTPTSTTRQLGRRIKHTTTTISPVTADDSEWDGNVVTTTAARTRTTRKRQMSFFGALFSSLGSMTPHRKSHNQTLADVDDLAPAEPSTAAPTTSTTIRPRKITTKVRKSVFGHTEEVMDTSGNPVPSFTDVFSGLTGMLAGSLFGGKGQADSDNYVPSVPRPIGYGNNGGRQDLTSVAGQKALMEKMKNMGATSASYSDGSRGSFSDFAKPKNKPGSKFAFDSAGDQVDFVKFLQTYDKYQPSGSQQQTGSVLTNVFPKPPPRTVTSAPLDPEPTAPPAPMLANPVPAVPNNAIAMPVDSLSPETWDLINKMQKPGYYNVTPEQLESLQPLLNQIKAHSPSQNPPAPSAPSPQQFPQPPPQPPFPTSNLPPMADLGGLFGGGGSPYSAAGSVPPVPPLLPQPLPTDSPTPPTPTQPPTTTTAATTTTTTSTAKPPPISPPIGEAKSLVPVPDGPGQFAQQAGVVKMPSQPPFKDVIQKHDCVTNCQQDDPNTFCDSRMGICVCKPGYHSSFLEGNICTKTIFSLCSGDEDCRSGGDMNAECAFNGQTRFCTCSNGYLPDPDGTCRPMFADRCTGICNIPNAVCDQFQGICRCPTGYAWFKDPWTGQPVCRAALGGGVPCRSDQDLCPIYTPRGKCRNNAFCGCEDGYIPDSWFTNQSERTSCIDVLSAKCDDSSECTVADRNTICDRRLRMCTCKPGYKPDQFHNSACVPAI